MRLALESEDAMKRYRRLDLYDRKIIEEGLDKGLSYASIAQSINRSVSTISQEVIKNRTLLKHSGKLVECKNKRHCTVKRLCPECIHPNLICSVCKSISCENVCRTWLEHTGCKKTASAPWVCNGCPKKSFGCNRRGRAHYRAIVADTTCKNRRSRTRSGVNMTEERFESVIEIVRSALARKLSPYEIATLYSEKLDLSISTLYRWVEKGYGGMTNLDLERKVGFKPRKSQQSAPIAYRGNKRSYAAFLALSQEVQDSCCEMDTVMGKKTDTQCILTLYLRPAHFQLYVLLKRKTLAQVNSVFDDIESLSRGLFKSLFSVILTDNGPEFEDPARLEKSIYPKFPSRCQIFYCDPHQSQQKGRCEKNHSELRQLLPKGKTTMDKLTIDQIAHINTTINSTPRKSLCGLSPIEMLCVAYKEHANEFLDAFSIDYLKPDEIDLRPIDTDSNDDDDNNLPF